MKKALYTINFGDYNPLREPLVITPGWDYVVFSDKDLQSANFKVKKHEVSRGGHLSARDFYINSQKYMPDYDLTVMIGSQIQVNCDLDKFLQKYCDLGCDFNMMNHGRNCIFKEANENKKFFGEKGKQRIDLQMERYKSEGMPENYGLFAHGIIIRQKSKEIAEHERLWWEEVKNPEYVTRDQLSFMYVLWRHGLVTVCGFDSYWDILHNEFKIFKHGTWKGL